MVGLISAFVHTRDARCKERIVAVGHIRSNSSYPRNFRFAPQQFLQRQALHPHLPRLSLQRSRRLYSAFPDVPILDALRNTLLRSVMTRMLRRATLRQLRGKRRRVKEDDTMERIREDVNTNGDIAELRQYGVTIGGSILGLAVAIVTILVIGINPPGRLAVLRDILFCTDTRPSDDPPSLLRSFCHPSCRGSHSCLCPLPRRPQGPFPRQGMKPLSAPSASSTLAIPASTL